MILGHHRIIIRLAGVIMDLSLYPMIYKRKSFHLFRNVGNASISESELKGIYAAYNSFASLIPDIKTEINIVPSSETTCRRGQEYCILMYSEKKDNYLANIGYLGQQLDLYLVSQNIGSLWFGIGKVQEKSYHGLDFVIMIAIRKVPDNGKFRKDMFKSKRKSVEEIWSGSEITNVTNIVRFAPSACNTQPWFVEHKDTSLLVYRYKKSGKRGIMPTALVSYYNRIDMGIFLCFLELCLGKEGISYGRKLYFDDGSEREKTLFSEYTLIKGEET